MQEVKEKIRQRLNIAQVVSETVALTASGQGRYKGLCPFHQEKTPSFHVLEDKGFYYCFGCQAKGDIFDFIMQTRNVSFGEALLLLGEQAGVEVTPPTAKERNKRDLFDVNQVALAYFRSHLQGEALAYLQRRQLTQQSIETFELGYAPEGWDGLLRHALHKGIAQQDLIEAGLVAESERSGRTYDRFRNRVIFPIKDALGRVVGFSGRVLDDSVPKYLNTPETSIFAKGSLLYGLDLAKSHIRGVHEAVVVEGYMDVIALHQVGISHTVAALGATLTEDQADLLNKLDVQTLYLAFDADSAGERAVLSGLEHSIGRQFFIKAARVPYGKDPADCVLAGHVEDFKEALTHGLSEVTYRLESVLAKHDQKTHEGKKAILTELLPALKPRDVFDPVASELKRLTVEALGLEVKRLDQWLDSRKPARLSTTHLKGMQRTEGQLEQAAHIELEVIALLLLEPRHLKKRCLAVDNALPSQSTPLLHEFSRYCEADQYNEQRLLERYRNRDEGHVVFKRLFERAQDENSRIDIEGHIYKCLARLRELSLSQAKEQQQQSLLKRQQDLAQKLADPALKASDLQQLYKELKEIQTLLASREAERRLRLIHSGPTARARPAK